MHRADRGLVGHGGSRPKLLPHKDALVSGRSATPGFLVADDSVEPLVLGHSLVRVEADFSKTLPQCFGFVEVYQRSPTEVRRFAKANGVRATANQTCLLSGLGEIWSDYRLGLLAWHYRNDLERRTQAAPLQNPLLKQSRVFATH